jgi:hypothetical protein
MYGTSMKMEREELHTEFWWGILKEKKLLGRRRHIWDENIEKIFKKWDGGVDWTNLVEDRKSWQAFVNGVMGSRFHKMRGIS